MTEFDKVIPPGGVGKVTASVSTEHYNGAVSKSISVTTNDPAQRTFVLRLAADVKGALFVSPTETPILRGKPKDLKPIELTLASADGKPFDITHLTIGPRLTVSVRPVGKQAPRAKKTSVANADDTTPIATGSSRYLVTVAVKPDAPVGHWSEPVTFLTSHPRSSSYPLRVNLTVLGDLEVAPERLVLRPEQTTQHVKIRKVEGDGLEITAVESSDPEIQASSATETKGRAYDVTVQYAGKPGRGPVNARVTVKTNEPSQSVIVIPVTGNF